LSLNNKIAVLGLGVFRKAWPVKKKISLRPSIPFRVIFVFFFSAHQLFFSFLRIEKKSGLFVPGKNLNAKHRSPLARATSQIRKFSFLRVKIFLSVGSCKFVPKPNYVHTSFFLSLRLNKQGAWLRRQPLTLACFFFFILGVILRENFCP
jgi:hypothetical protein